MSRQAGPLPLRHLKLGDLLRQRLYIIDNGSLTVILQDSHAIQINISEISYSEENTLNQSGLQKGGNGLDQNRYAGIRERRSEGLEEAIRIMKSIHYGSVTLVIQGGEIVQIEKNEKVRIR